MSDDEHLSDFIEDEDQDYEEVEEEADACATCDNLVEEEKDALESMQEASTGLNAEIARDGDISDYFIQHGAHREYRVPMHLIQHQAPENMKVTSGERIGEMIASRSGKTWSGLKWYHVWLIGGKTTSGAKESAPYVCFDPPDGVCPEDTNDSHWLRPIPAKVMEYHIPVWKAEIEAKYKESPEASLEYKKVLKWTSNKLSGQRLDPKSFPVGNGGFVPLEAGMKLKSIRVAPEPVPRNSSMKGETSSHGTKLTSAISKSQKKGSMSRISMDMQSDASDVTAVPNARVIRIGPVNTTSTYVFDGVIYATLMP